MSVVKDKISPILVQFIYTDGGRSQSRRPKQRKDCAIRACSIALNLNYDVVFDQMKALGRRCGHGTAHDVTNEYLSTKPVKKLTYNLSLSRFILDHPEGTYIVRIPRHLSCIIDGAIHDDHLYGYYLTSIPEVWQVVEPPKMKMKLRY